MKSLGELMTEIGFNKNASVETQKAFLKNLIQAANAQAPRSEPAPQIEAAPPAKVEAPPVVMTKKPRKEKPLIKEQLEFNFGEVDRVS